MSAIHLPRVGAAHKRARCDCAASGRSGHRQDYADFVRQQLLHVPSVAKVELFGVQDEKINIEFSHKKFAQLGIPFDAIVGQLDTQNSVESSGVLVTSTDNLQVRVTGAVRSIKDLDSRKRFRLPSMNFCVR